MGDKMNIGIASDHRGYKLKQELTNFLKDIGYNINYINISEEFKNNKYIDKTSNYPNKKGYEYISNKIINLIEN